MMSWDMVLGGYLRASVQGFGALVQAGGWAGFGFGSGFGFGFGFEIWDLRARETNDTKKALFVLSIYSRILGLLGGRVYCMLFGGMGR